jgi:hypothetical protein
MQSSAIRWREGTKRCAALFREGEMVGGISGGSVVDPAGRERWSRRRWTARGSRPVAARVLSVERLVLSPFLLRPAAFGLRPAFSHPHPRPFEIRDTSAACPERSRREIRMTAARSPVSLHRSRFGTSKARYRPSTGPSAPSHAASRPPRCRDIPLGVRSHTYLLSAPA